MADDPGRRRLLQGLAAATAALAAGVSPFTLLQAAAAEPPTEPPTPAPASGPANSPPPPEPRLIDLPWDDYFTLNDGVLTLLPDHLSSMHRVNVFAIEDGKTLVQIQFVDADTNVYDNITLTEPVRRVDAMAAGQQAEWIHVYDIPNVSISGHDRDPVGYPGISDNSGVFISSPELLAQGAMDIRLGNNAVLQLHGGLDYDLNQWPVDLQAAANVRVEGTNAKVIQNSRAEMNLTVEEGASVTPIIMAGVFAGREDRIAARHGNEGNGYEGSTSYTAKIVPQGEDVEPRVEVTTPGGGQKILTWNLAGVDKLRSDFMDAQERRHVQLVSTRRDDHALLAGRIQHLFNDTSREAQWPDNVLRQPEMYVDEQFAGGGSISPVYERVCRVSSDGELARCHREITMGAPSPGSPRGQ